MHRIGWILGLILALAACSGGGNGVEGSAPGDDVVGGDVQVSPEPVVPNEPLNSENTMSPQKQKMGQYYAPVAYEAEGAIEPYDLPLAAEDLSNLAQVQWLLGPDGAQEQLLEDGFVVVPFLKWGQEPVEDIAEPYALLEEQGIPAFVTVDTWLHLYHVQFDELLKTLEEDRFFGDILRVTETLLADAEALYGTSDGLLKEAARRNVAFLHVARQLLAVEDEPDTDAPTPPAYVAAEVEAELALIEAHQGFTDSPLFLYKEDYSQYVPRGHYTRSERLKSYFRAMMWYGRLTMLLKGGEPACEYDACPALILPYDADAQTVQALLLTMGLAQLDTDAGTALELWEEIYHATSFFVGISDDLTFYEYLETIHAVLGEAPVVEALVDEATLFEIRADLSLKRSPQIYGGTGGQVILVASASEITPEMLEELLDKSKGFRLMGQRFIPDSYIMGRLVSPGAGALSPDGDTDAFTAVLSQVGWIRGFPRGLDVMAVLGSDRAAALLNALHDDQYTDYAETFGEMQAFVDEQTDEQWHMNLYWGWLHALRALLEPAPPGSQTCMQTEAWTTKSLNTALASWAELRHDTILYAKQSYTPGFESSVPPPPPSGYVEPAPEFYARLLALNEMTIAGLEDLGVMPEEAAPRLEALSTVLGRMLEISLVELAGQPLSAADVAYIDGIAGTLDLVVAGVEDTGVKTTMVADVHTDQNSKEVLEEGVGYVELMVVAYRLADGQIALGAGPVLSYYEFRHPMDDRLTDEKWREILAGTSDVAAPAQPEWTEAYRVE